MEKEQEEQLEKELQTYASLWMVADPSQKRNLDEKVKTMLSEFHFPPSHYAAIYHHYQGLKASHSTYELPEDRV